MEIVERLRAGRPSELQLEAATVIERLHAALKPFCWGDPIIEQLLFGAIPDSAAVTNTMRLGDLRNARKALNIHEGREGK